jgi:hypothetical protein
MQLWSLYFYGEDEDRIVFSHISYNCFLCLINFILSTRRLLVIVVIDSVLIILLFKSIDINHFFKKITTNHLISKHNQFLSQRMVSFGQFLCLHLTTIHFVYHSRLNFFAFRLFLFLFSKKKTIINYFILIVYLVFVCITMKRNDIKYALFKLN